MSGNLRFSHDMRITTYEWYAKAIPLQKTMFPLQPAAGAENFRTFEQDLNPIPSVFKAINIPKSSKNPVLSGREMLLKQGIRGGRLKAKEFY